MKIEFPPPYTREIWDYNKAETNFIKHSIENVYWRNLFLGKHLHLLVEILNQTILNIFHNFVPNKTIFCGDRDPPWINEKNQVIDLEEHAFYRSQKKSINFDYTNLDAR